MSKICPNCQEVYDDNHAFCFNCGSRLVDNVDVNPVLNLGDANAISGGVSINQSKNITSHDTHYHTTMVQERAKSESEIKLDASNQLRGKAEEIMEQRGRIDSVAMGQLRPMALHLGIDDDTFKSIIRDVRSNRNGSSSGLSVANARYLLQAQQAVQTNDMDGLSNLTPRLEAMAAISHDDNVQYLYYLTLSLFYPIKSMEVYEHQTDENYWRSYWAIVSYIRNGKNSEATSLLAKFDPLRYEKSEDDQNLLEAYFNTMKNDKDGAQEFLDEILGEPTEQVKPMLRAIEATLYEEEAENLEVRFYMERIMTKTDVVVKSTKNVETPAKAKEVVDPKSKLEKTEKTVSKEQPISTTPAPTTKTTDEAEKLFSQACAASGAKRVMLLQKAADAGSLEAMYDLGDCYGDGEGVEKNMALAIKWLTKSADAGYTLAQAALGGAYFTGIEGLDQNYALAEKYTLMAAEKGDIDAQAGLAVLYVAMEEYDKALKWARKASQASNPLACYMLGRIYNEGLGVDVNNLEGLKWYEEAAKYGDADAQNIVGNIYTDADFVEHDYKKAFEYYQKAAAQGHAYGMFNLGLCYRDGQGTKKNISLAKEWIQKAADAGAQEAIESLDENTVSGSSDAEDNLKLVEEEVKKQQKKAQKKSSKEKKIENTSDGEKDSSVKILEVTGNSYYGHSLDINWKIKVNGYNGRILTIRHTAKPKQLRRKTLNSKEQYWIPFTFLNTSDLKVMVASDYNIAKDIAEIYKQERSGKFSDIYIYRIYMILLNV